MRRLGFSVLLLGVGLIGLPQIARAEHACREKAREVHGTLYAQATSGTATEESVERAFFGALGINPECESEFRTLAAWYLERNQGQFSPFPFPESEDPRHTFLGPVGAWWNIVRFDILNGSWLLFFLFGWELFLTPIIPSMALAFGIIGALFGLGRSRPQLG